MIRRHGEALLTAAAATKRNTYAPRSDKVAHIEAQIWLFLILFILFNEQDSLSCLA